MKFRDRDDAARQLAAKLDRYRGTRPLVLGVPRGGVPMARRIADELGGETDVVLVHKLGAPGQPELAIGAVDENGQVMVNDVAAAVGADAGYIEAERARQLERLRRRRAQYTPVRDSIDPAGRTVVIVDDGVATGATMVMALRAVRARHPARLVAAMAVASRQAIDLLTPEADEVVAVSVPAWFNAVGAFFEDFSEVSDDDAVRALHRDPPRGREGSGPA